MTECTLPAAHRPCVECLAPLRAERDEAQRRLEEVRQRWEPVHRAVRSLLAACQPPAGSRIPGAVAEAIDRLHAVERVAWAQGSGEAAAPALDSAAKHIEKLEHDLAAEQGKSAALEWLRREQYQRWSSAHDDLCLVESLLVLAVERATKAEQDCDILEAASAHWQAECAKAERERDEARR